ncbi:MAG: O-antigen ligase family protein [candidate division SR1 bacterium]|nr:O-antigen ligase family protein [candidate division SR1 bacterium]
MEASNKLIKTLTLVAKIFFIGLLLQFFFQTLVTYRLGLTGAFWKVFWMRKEIIIIGLIGFLGRYFWKNRIGAQTSEGSLTPISIYGNNLNFPYGKNLKEFFEKFPLKNFVRVFLATIVVSFLVSVFINHTGIETWIMSIRYSMIGFLIFIVFFTVTILFFGAREINLVKRYSRLMKTLLVGSLIWRGILWLIPNALKFAGYNQYNYEGDVGIAPPAAYYTQFDSGYARNQFLFERPISRGFFLIAFWPLFFMLCFKNRSLKDKILRGSLYGVAIMSTFSRAAWGVWIIQTIILVLLQFPRKYWKMALRGFIPLLVVFGGVTYFGQKQIITREFSNTGHFRLVVEALQKIGERPLWGQGAGTAGPASHQIEGIKAYNPENQYLQIRLEYGFLGFIGRLFLYGYLHQIAYKAYEEEKNTDNKITKKKKMYGAIVFAFGVGILGLSIEGLVLQSFVDRMIVYPFMALFAIAYGLYVKESLSHKQSIHKEEIR